MKKFLSTVLALAVAATMTTSTLAATAIDTDGATSASGKVAGDYTIGVTGTYAPATSAASTVSVDISWEDMNFTYNEGSKGDWNSATHDYDNAVASGWKSDEKSTITVKNHSNIAVKADFTFAGVNGVKGNFTKDSLTLVSADDDTYRATEGTTPTAPTATTDFSIDTTSPAITATGSIGTITVKISVVTWTTVTTKEQLVTAFESGSNIKLGADITDITDIINIDNAASTIIDLNGHELSGADQYSFALLYIKYKSALTVKDSVGGGKIESKNSGRAFCVDGKLTLESGTLHSSGLFTIFSEGAGEVIVSGGTVSSNSGASINSLAGTTLTVTGGNFTSELEISGKATISGGTFGEVVKVCSGETAISGGTFNDNIEADAIKPIVTGGTFSNDPTPFVNTKDYTVSNEDGTYTVTTGGTGIDKGDSTDETWTTVTTESGLRNALSNGGNIKLGDNITVTSPIYVNGVVATLDLNGYRLYCPNDVTLFIGESKSSIFTVKDSGTGGEIASGSSIALHTVYANVTIEGGKFNGNSCALNVGGMAHVTVNGGEFVSSAEYVQTITVNGKLIINNATVSSDNGWAISPNSVTHINGGTFSGSEGVFENFSGLVTITGGTFSEDPTSYVNTEKYTVTDNDDGTWTVTAK